MWLLPSMMEEWMPSSNALSPEMLFPPVRERLKWGFEVLNGNQLLFLLHYFLLHCTICFHKGEGMLNYQKSFRQRRVDERSHLMRWQVPSPMSGRSRVRDLGAASS